MRKELYVLLSRRLQQLVVLADGSIQFISEEALKRLEESGAVNYAIRHIGLWNRQVEFIEEEAVFDFPAVFIEFGKMEWAHEPGGGQYTPLLMGLHVLERWTPTSCGESLAYLDLLEQINACLNGFCGNCFASMERVTSIPCHDHGEILENTEVFRTRAYDASAIRERIKLKPTVSISKQ